MSDFFSTLFHPFFALIDFIVAHTDATLVVSILVAVAIVMAVYLAVVLVLFLIGAILEELS